MSLAEDATWTLKQEAIDLDQKFAAWHDAQLDSFKPRTLGHVSDCKDGNPPEVGCWPGKVDTYFDLYVAAVWNTYRTVRCLLLSLILNLSTIANDSVGHGIEHRTAMHLVEDAIASIPFHLTEDLHALLRDAEDSKEISEPGRKIGGLLSMQPLHVLSRLAIVPLPMRKYLKDCLKWIGGHMGIGQASLYAQVSGGLALVLRYRFLC